MHDAGGVGGAKLTDTGHPQHPVLVHQVPSQNILVVRTLYHIEHMPHIKAAILVETGLL